WSVIGDYGGINLAFCEDSLIEGNYDRVVARLPDGIRGDLIHYVPDKLIAAGDEKVLLHSSGGVRVHTPGWGSVHVVALIGNDVAEIGNGPRGKIVRQLLQWDHLRELSWRLQVGEIYHAVVFRDVLRIGIRNAVALVRIAVAAITRVRHVLEIPLPSFAYT